MSGNKALGTIKCQPSMHRNFKTSIAANLRASPKTTSMVAYIWSMVVYIWDSVMMADIISYGIGEIL